MPNDPNTQPWGAPIFVSADGGSGTFRVSGTEETVWVRCRMGRCNERPQIAKVFNRQPEPGYITVSAGQGLFTSITQGSPTTATLGCLPANVGTAFEATINPNPVPPKR